MDDAEFEAALAAQVASSEETPTETTEPEAPEAEATPEATDEPEAVEEVEEEPEAPQFGEEVSSYLSKYGGDVGKALEAAIHAQSKVGEQGQELGELRRMVQELMDRPEPKSPSSPFVPEQIQSAIEENPASVAQWAITNEQPQVYEAAMSEWYDTDPKAATRFEITLNREMARQEILNQVSTPLETVKEQEKARSLNDAHRSLAAKYEDFQQVLESATEQETAGIDRNLLQTVLDENPTAAMEMVYRWVKSGRGQQAAQEAAQRTESKREEKRQAAVATAETTTVPAADKTAQEKLAEFMLTPDPWSVRDGLTS